MPAHGLKHEVKSILGGLGASARKKLGQNFMVDEEALKFIADAGHIREGETVLEVGPGLGFLTRCLIERGARVIAFEKDRAYAGHLRKVFKGKELEIVEGDFLKADLTGIAGADRIKLFGNIPYNITSPILERLVFFRREISEAVITVQREVGLRLKASPGSKDWGSLSLFLQYYADVEMLKIISPESFDPRPKVFSAVLKIILRQNPVVHVRDEPFFFDTARRAFQKRRKTLLNALAAEKKGFDKKELMTCFQRCGIDSSRRPETLSLSEWASIANLISI